jgi:hypothetical protein
LAGLGPLKTQYDPAKRVYRNMPTAVQPRKWQDEQQTAEQFQCFKVQQDPRHPTPKLHSNPFPHNSPWHACHSLWYQWDWDLN